jgi:hypothetical protein
MEPTNNIAHFYQINREERHLGFLLMAALIYEETFREKFFRLVNGKLKQQSEEHDWLKTNVGEFELYAEVALFRDYWRSLGDPDKWDEELKKKRTDFIECLLEKFGINGIKIDQEEMFWTKDIGTSKVWFPGHWSKNWIETLARKIGTPGLEDKLFELKWVCNAKPDIFIKSGKNAVIVELKVESKNGKYGKYDQGRIQEEIANKAPDILPFLNGCQIKRIMVARDGEQNINWENLINGIENDFVKRHLSKMPKQS